MSKNHLVALFLVFFFTLPAKAANEQTLTTAAAVQPAICKERFDAIWFVPDDATQGTCYGLAIPSRLIGGDGRTDIHRFENGVDRIIHSFPWYEDNFSVMCDWTRKDGFSFVREIDGRGKHLKKADYTVLEFYLDGRLIKSYSASQIANKDGPLLGSECGDNLYTQTSFASSLGQRRMVELTMMGKRIMIDYVTGEIVTP